MNYIPYLPRYYGVEENLVPTQRLISHDFGYITILLAQLPIVPKVI